MSRMNIVLMAHGSTESANATIHQLATDVASAVNADCVTAAFLNGSPRITDVLEEFDPGQVTVVPIMTSNGYYLGKLPELLRENCNYESLDVSITPVVGTHQDMAVAMSQRLDTWLQRQQLDPAQTTVVVIGHGTARNANSCQSTLDLVEHLQALNQWENLEFQPAFLDQQPALKQVVAEVTRPNVIALPFLISPGPHLVEDVTAALGMEKGRFPLIGQRSSVDKANQPGVCICDCALVEYPEMRSVVLDLIAGVPV